MELTSEQLFALREAAGMIGLDDYRENYSGRGMRGRQSCVGIVGDAGDLVEYVLAVASMEPELAKQLIDVSEDSVAMDTIYYWRDLYVEESE